MNLEKFLELVLTNPDNISIQYSNINGEEKLIVNGKDLSKEEGEKFGELELKLAETAAAFLGKQMEQ